MIVKNDCQSAQIRLTGHHKLEARTVFANREIRSTNLRRLATAIIDFRLSQQLLGLRRVEMHQRRVCGVSTGLLEKSDVRLLATPTLPGHVQSIVAAGFHDTFCRLRLGQVRQEHQFPLLQEQGPQFNLEEVELLRISLQRPIVKLDKPTLLGWKPAIASATHTKRTTTCAGRAADFSTGTGRLRLNSLLNLLTGGV